MKEQIINSENLQESLDSVISKKSYDKIFVLTDTNTQRHCLPLFTFDTSYRPSAASQQSKQASLCSTCTSVNFLLFTFINVEPGEDSKSFSTVEYILKKLIENNASRHSLMINLGGGVITDLGGFVASIFKRGIDYINIPTTLLAMVDASVGGKTGINFSYLKNSVGCFNPPVSVLINTKFLETLDYKNILSGYAEVLKHSLLYSEKKFAESVQLIINNSQQQIFENVKIKERFVESDPFEKGIRKALNFGHTFGHAFESFCNLPHGYAVAFGLICELYLSCIKCNFPQEKMRQTVNFIKENYGTLNIECKDYDTLISLMKNDKKNNDGRIIPVLLENIGKPIIDLSITEEEIKEAFDFLREC